MNRRALAVALSMLLWAVRGFAGDLLQEKFLGDSLGMKWVRVNEDNCTLSVDNGLVLNPQSPYRQAAVGTAQNTYLWSGRPRSYQFTVGAWSIVTNSNISLRFFLVGNDAGMQPDSYSDYNKPNVLMGKLDLYQGVFYWNLFVKTGAEKRAADAEEFKRGYMTVGTAAVGRTFGVTLNRNRARLWWKTAEGKKFESEEIIVPEESFNWEGTLYIAAKNDNGNSLGPAETIKVSGISIAP